MTIDEYGYMEFSPTRPKPATRKSTGFPMKELVVAECINTKCGNRQGKRCRAVNFPASMWMNGKRCWAYTDDPFHHEAVAVAVECYKERLRQKEAERQALLAAAAAAIEPATESIEPETEPDPVNKNS